MEEISALAIAVIVEEKITGTIIPFALPYPPLSRLYGDVDPPGRGREIMLLETISSLMLVRSAVMVGGRRSSIWREEIGNRNRLLDLAGKL
jgi:hypothetical protein